MAERETTAWNVVKALQPPENKGRRVFDGCLMGGGFASCLLPQKSLDNMTPNQAGFVKMNFVNRTSHSGLPPFGFVNGLLLVVIELKEPGVPGLAFAFIQSRRDESALLSSRRDRRENCDTL